MSDTQKSAASENPFAVIGERAPDFSLDATGGGKWRLSENAGTVTALLFYPKNETLVCTKQLCSVRDNWAKYLETKAAIVAISPGTIEEHLTFARRYRLPLPILADAERLITKIYSRHWLMPVEWTRAVVVINAKGIISHQQVFCRAFRPTDESVIASIYAARADAIIENSIELVKKSNEKNIAVLND